MIGLKKKKTEDIKNDANHQELLRELEAAKNAMDTAYANLSYVIEPELIDCCIYELNAVQLRYKFILSQVMDIEKIKG